MCLTIRPLSVLKNIILGPKYRIAKKDIPVYKLLKLNRDGSWESPIQEYPYTLNIVMVSPLENLTRKHLYLEIGLHSYRNQRNALQALLYMHSIRTLMLKAIIPKGSLYIKGVGGEIISNQLIVLEEHIK
jgi:hypothetical protein